MSNSSEEDAFQNKTVSFSNPLIAASSFGPSSSNTSLAATSVDTTLPLQPTAVATDLHEGTPSILNYFRKIKNSQLEMFMKNSLFFIIY